MSWVHDNEIIAYTVDVDGQTVTLNTKYAANGPGDGDEHAVVKFTGVVAHLFDEVACHNVIYDIYAFPLEQFLDDNRDMLDRQFRRNSGAGYHWPVGCDCLEEMLDKLRADHKAYFSIDSVVGLCGWVLADAVTITVNGERKPLE